MEGYIYCGVLLESSDNIIAQRIDMIKGLIFIHEDLEQNWCNWKVQETYSSKDYIQEFGKFSRYKSRSKLGYLFSKL